MKSTTLEGSAEIYWSYPDIGTCGNKIDTLRIDICRTRAIRGITIGFDGERDGWVIFDDSGTKEIGFIPEQE